MLQLWQDVKMSHKSIDCKEWKKNKFSQANVVKSNLKESEIILSIVIFEVNMIGSNHKEWFIDINATNRHIISSNSELFTTFKASIGDKGLM